MAARPVVLEMLQLQQGGKGASPGPNLPSETILALLAREVMTQVNKLQLAPGRPQAAQARQHQGRASQDWGRYP